MGNEVSKFTNPTDVGSELQFIKNKIFSIGALDLSVPGCFAQFDWGPVNEPTKVTTESDFAEIFKGGTEAWKSILILFRRFGLEQVVVNRVIHYTDPTDKATITSEKASHTVDNGVATNVLTVEGRYHGTPGNDISYKTTKVNKLVTSNTTAIDNAATTVTVEVSDQINVGEIIHMTDTTENHYAKVTKKIGDTLTFTPAVTGFAGPIAIGQVVKTLNFDLEVFFQDALQDRKYENLSLEPENIFDFIANIIPRDSNHLYNVLPLPTGAADLELRTPTDGTRSLVGGLEGDAVVAGDYIGDVTAKTGFFALDLYGHGKLPVNICVPELIDGAVQVAAIAYAEDKIIHNFVGDFSLESDDDDIIDWLDLTVKVNSEWSSYQYPNLILEDPENEGIFLTLKNSLFVIGRWGITDKGTDSGPWNNSANVTYGTLPAVFALEPVLKNGELKVLTQNPDIRTKLKIAKINSIYEKNGAFLIESAFTRAKGRNLQFPHINQIRTFQYVGASVDFSLQWVNMLNHDNTIERQVRDLVETFIDTLPGGALFGESPAQRRNVVCGPANNPRTEDGFIKDPEELFVDIYLSVQTPILRAHYRVQKSIGQ